MNLKKIVHNINNSQHRITGFTSNKIQEAVLENDEELLNKSQENELEKRKETYQKEFFILKI
jgi:acetyl-CoA carboxylase alpha subunit